MFDPDALPQGIEACAELRARHPSAALLPYGSLAGDRVPVASRLAELGIEYVVVRGQNDEPRALRERVCAMLARRFADGVVQRIGDLFPEPLHPLLRFLLVNPCPPVDAERAARSQHCHPRVLRARLRNAGLPPLKRLIVWTRLMYAAHLLAGTGRDTAQVARDAGYPTATAFRAQVQRYAGIPARELRGACGLERLLERFRARCLADAGTAATEMED